MCLFIVCLVFLLATNLDKSHIHLDFIFAYKLFKVERHSKFQVHFIKYKCIKKKQITFLLCEFRLTLWDKNTPNDDNFLFFLLFPSYVTILTLFLYFFEPGGRKQQDLNVIIQLNYLQ